MIVKQLVRCRQCFHDLEPPKYDAEVPDDTPADDFWTMAPPTLVKSVNCPLKCEGSEYVGRGHPDQTVLVTCASRRSGDRCLKEWELQRKDADALPHRICPECVKGGA